MKFWSGAQALRTAATALFLGVLAAPYAVAADGLVVEPHNWQLGFQEAATPVKERIADLNNELMIIITLITVLVVVLLGYVILVIIAIPSFKLMYYMDRTQKADMTIKVTGHQWYWSYEYPDFKDVGFDSNIIPEDQIKPGQKRLLDVDNRLIVPVGANVRVLIAGSDVMHSWFVPSFGVQMYAVPGRLNETWFNVEKEGTYYGQCNQICGVNHAFMPIVVQAVSKDDFAKWIDAKEKAASNDAAPSGKAVRVAGAVPSVAMAQ
jgi:cytochrome c oxidase subunit II